MQKKGYASFLFHRVFTNHFSPRPGLSFELTRIRVHPPTDRTTF